MKITRDVVTDLLPAYFSEEASADSRALIKEFFAADPEFEQMARTLANARERIEVATPAQDSEAEKETLRKTRAMLHSRNAWFAFGIAYLLASLLSLPRHGHWWILFRENPFAAKFFFLFGLLCCGLSLFFNWRLRKTGL